MTFKGMFEKAKRVRHAQRNPISALRLIEALVLICGIFIFGYALTIGVAGKNDDSRFTDPPTEMSVPVEPADPAQTQDKDYSRFTHTNAFHSRLPCLLCHRRDDNSPRIRFPGKPDHLPCAGCHALQFSDNTSPICTICHTNAETGAMKKFPSLRSFGFKFDHSRHTRVNCATCHKSTGRGGAGLTIPSGAAAHSTCFQCHSSRSSPAMVSCNVCHQSGRPVRTSEWSVAFRKSFNHTKHVAAKNVDCATCHTMRPGASRGRQMSKPLVSMHFAPAQSVSCGGCHNGQRAFGPDDFTNCKRCHQGKTFKF
jgi:c(7)-type cytochrome triheme protein